MTSKCHKGRLLHYFPTPQAAPQESSPHAQWCGWHLDHSILTGLVSALYTDSQLKQVPSPDSQAGLYVKTRGKDIRKVVIPDDCMAFQLGECSQIATGGHLCATPHCVQGAKKGSQIGRNTFACFFQPQWDTILA
eukprot:Sdes_comp19546_c0_seq2m11170